MHICCLRKCEFQCHTDHLPLRPHLTTQRATAGGGPAHHGGLLCPARTRHYSADGSSAAAGLRSRLFLCGCTSTFFGNNFNSFPALSSFLSNFCVAVLQLSLNAHAPPVRTQHPDPVQRCRVARAVSVQPCAGGSDTTGPRHSRGRLSAGSVLNRNI